MSRLENLVFEGGGLSGFSEIWALHHLVSKQPDFLRNVTTASGSSIGSLVALMCVLGVFDQPDAARLTNISSMRHRFSQKFKQLNPTLWSGLWNLFRNNGMIRPQRQRELIVEVLDIDFVEVAVVKEILLKTGRTFLSELTLHDLYVATGKTLITTVHNVQSLENVYLHYGTSPQLLVVDAVATSMNFPFMFQPVKHISVPNQPAGWFVDGGLLDNYPIWLGRGPPQHDNFFDVDKTSTHPKTLGFKIMTDQEQLNRDVYKPKTDPNMSLIQYALNVVRNALSYSNEGAYLTTDAQAATIRLPGIGLFDFDALDDENRWTDLRKDTLAAVDTWWEQNNIAV